MVFYEPPKRQPRKGTDGKITDLPDELLLDVLDRLDPLDFLRFRATCRAFTPAGNTAITRRMKKLYVSPSRSSLLAAVEICAHPTFSSSIEEVVVLGSTPQREEREWRGREGRFQRGFGELLTTWPTTFPSASKTAASQDKGDSSGSFFEVYKPLLDALSTLPRVKKLSFASTVSRTSPGFNQVKQASLQSFPKRHVGKPSARDKRWSDGYAMFAILASLGPQIQDFGFCENLADAYSDLRNAEDEFALSLVRDNILEVDQAKTTNAGRVYGNFFGRQGTFYMPDYTFSVSKTSAIAGIRRHCSNTGPLEIQYTQHDGREGRVNLWMGRIGAA